MTKKLTKSQHRYLASWIFGTLLVVFFISVFILAPESLPEFKQRILAFFAATLAGLFGYFLTGTIGLTLSGVRSQFGEVGVNATGGAALFVGVLVWWSSPWAPVTPGDGLVTVRVTVLGPENVPVEDAKVWSSLGGEPQKVSGGWELEIPEAKIPSTRKLTIYAAKESAFLSGETSIELGQQGTVATTINLARDTSANVKGIVADAQGTGIEGVRVNVVGFEQEAVETDSSGSFSIPAHAAVGQDVRLHAEKTGYKSADRYHPAGNEPAYIVLQE